MLPAIFILYKRSVHSASFLSFYCARECGVKNNVSHAKINKNVKETHFALIINTTHKWGGE